MRKRTKNKGTGFREPEDGISNLKNVGDREAKKWGGSSTYEKYEKRNS